MVSGFRRRGLTDPQITAAIIMGVVLTPTFRGRWQRQALEFMGINAERILNFVETGVDSANPAAEKSLSKI